MLGNHDIQRSRNFRKKKTTVTFANSKKKKREGFQHNMHGFRN